MLLNLITPLLSNSYVWSSVIIALGCISIWIYVQGKRNGRESERKRIQKQEAKERKKYEENYNIGANMSESERAEWVQRFTGKNK